MQYLLIFCCVYKFIDLVHIVIRNNESYFDLSLLLATKIYLCIGTGTEVCMHAYQLLFLENKSKTNLYNIRTCS